jgi:hypothetical protein
MKLYVCWGTFTTAPRPGGHPCGNAYRALTDAGHDPEVERTYGYGALPEFMNPTRGRRKVKELTGEMWVPVLVTDEDEVIAGSKKIIAWAKANPARASAEPQSA